MDNQNGKMIDKALQVLLQYPDLVQNFFAGPISYASVLDFFAYLARLKRCMEFCAENAHQEFEKEKKTLEEGESYLKNHLPSVQQDIQAVLENNFSREMADLENALETVRHAALGIFLDSGTPDAEEDAQILREAGLDFLQRFQKTHDALKTLTDLKIIEENEFIAYQGRFAETENLLGRYFGYFHPLREEIVQLHNEECLPDTWWLNTLPDPETTPEARVQEKDFAFCRGMSFGADGECKMEEKVISYALGEAFENEARETEEHLKNCSICLSLYMDILYTEAMAEKDPAPAEPASAWMPFLEDRKKKPEKKDYFLHSGKAVFGFLAEAKKNLFSPRLIPVYALVCLVFVSGIYTWYKSTLPITADMTILVAQGYTRGGDATGISKLEEGGKIATGAYFFVDVELEQSGYVSAVLSNSQGRTKILFANEKLPKGKTRMPRDNTGFFMDIHTGEETLFLLTGKKPLPDPEGRLRSISSMTLHNLRKEFPETAIQTRSFPHT